MLHSFLANAQSIEQVDKVLDKLEQRLLDDESETFSANDRNSVTTIAPKKEATTKMKFDKEIVYGNTRDSDELAKLAALISQLETRTDTLASNVQRTKQKVIDDATVDNYVAVEAGLTETDAAAIKTLNVRIDGFDVYGLHDATGLWLPSKSVGIYAGPLKPGNHRLDVELRLVLRHAKGLPLNSDVFRYVNKSFNFVIPNGRLQSRFMLQIVPPSKESGQADATFKKVL
jgi:hypothetical protein